MVNLKLRINKIKTLGTILVQHLTFYLILEISYYEAYEA